MCHVEYAALTELSRCVQASPYWFQLYPCGVRKHDELPQNGSTPMGGVLHEQRIERVGEVPIAGGDTRFSMIAVVENLVYRIDMGNSQLSD